MEVSKGFTFPERVQWIMDGRAIGDWADAIGLSRKAAERLSCGKLPDMDSFIRLGCIEGISASWLLWGKGPPYIPYTVADDPSGAAMLDSILDEGECSRYCVVNEDRWLLLFVRSALSEGTDRSIPYSQTEVLAGPLGDQTWRRFTDQGKYGRIEVDTATFRALSSGYIGPRVIAGSGRDKGLLGGARTVNPRAGRAARAVATRAQRWWSRAMRVKE